MGECKAPLTERGRHRRDCILCAATEVFLEQGFEAASVNEIVRRAGGSMSTLYKLFGSKEGLFEAMIARKATAVFGPLEQTDFRELPPEQALTALGRRVLDVVLSEEALPIYRVVLAEGARNPRLRRMFLRNTFERCQATLAGYLDEQVRRGNLELGNTRLAAAQFVEMAKAEFHLRALMGEPMASSEADRDAAVAQAVSIFLHGASNH